MLDTKPRPGGLTAQQGFALEALARQAMDQLELRRAVAERDRSLAEQRGAASLNRLILDSAIDYAIVATDRDGRVTRWNEGARRVLGWTAEEMLGQTTERFFTPEDVADGQVQAEMRAALDTGRGNDERWHRREGGERFWAQGEMTVLRDERGAAVGFLKVLRDRTEQRRAEATLRASEARLDALVRASSEVLYSVSADWGELRQLSGSGFLADTNTANPSWLTEYIPADERPRVGAAIAEAIRGKGIFHLEHRVRRADGSVGWALSRAVPLFDEAGEVTEWFGAASDVTPQREAENALRRLNATLAKQVEERTRDRNSLWELSSDIMLRCGFDGTITAVNPAWTELLGWREEELLGANLFDLVHPDDVERSAEGARTLREGGFHRRFDNRYRHRDGGYRWISWSARVGQGRINAVGRDVTAEKELAEERQHLEEQLRQSQKMEAVGQLTGGLAHDFNNLLAGISGSLELMQTRVGQGRINDLERYLAAAQGAAKRAAALTHRLLAFSRRQTLDPRPTDVNRLVAGMEELVRRTVGPTVRVETVAAEGLWNTLVDPGQLENALLNLCINARDAVSDGGRITVETGNTWLDNRAARAQEVPPGPYVALCVSDDGTGMTPEVAARAFDPFFTTKPLGQGTGLGLSMIHGFARQSGGQARIHSEVGRGTRVCLYLPRHQGAEGGAEPPPELAEAPRAERGETVLVVDDEPTVRMLVTEVLEDLGYTAVEAADGAAGLQVLRSDARIDLLVTDVGLPGGMNGRQVADAARASRPGLKVLFITGYAANAVLDHGHLEPGMHVMTKPFAMEALASRIREIIAGGPGGSPGGGPGAGR